MDRIQESNWEKLGQGHETILIVEDEPLMARLLEKVFSGRGYRVLSASDGEQAIEVFHCYKGRISLVLLDFGLPKITGWEVFLKIKEENPDVSIVIASGYLDPMIKAKMAYAGVMHFVNKPYILDEMVKTVKVLTTDPGRNYS